MKKYIMYWAFSSKESIVETRFQRLFSSKVIRWEAASNRSSCRLSDVLIWHGLMNRGNGMKSRISWCDECVGKHSLNTPLGGISLNTVVPSLHSFSYRADIADCDKCKNDDSWRERESFTVFLKEDAMERYCWFLSIWIIRDRLPIESFPK